MKKKGEGKNSDNGKREEILQKAGAYSAVFFMAFFVALVSASAFTPVDKSNASTGMNVQYSSDGYSLSLASFGGNDETPGKVNIKLAGTPGGAMAVEYDKLQVTTNSPGYKVYIGMDGADQKLLNTTATGDDEACENVTDETNCHFSPTSGTPSTPTTLAVNTWGYAVPNAAGLGNFSATYTTSNKRVSTGVNTIEPTNSSIDTTNTFAAVPAKGNEVMVAKDTVAATEGKDFYIYYGLVANTTLVSGQYEGTVVYTALAEASSTTGQLAVSPLYQKTLDGSGSDEGRITVETTIYGGASVVMDDIEVKIGRETCANPVATAPSGGISPGNDGPIGITCDTPTMKRYGTYDVVATIGDYGEYKLENGYSYYIPWAEMEAHPGQYSMQQFTTKACSEPNTPAAYTGTIAGGDYQAVTDVPEVTLYDARNEDHVYRVRKLADGNCWMVDNLRLTLDDSVALTSLDSDINYNMDTGASWDGNSTTETRTISNPLKVNGPVLGTYSTDSSTGVISWTPYVDSQTTSGISWGSPYSSCADGNSDGKIVESECTLATSGGTQLETTTKYFGPNAITGSEETVTPSANWHSIANSLAETARSYDNAGAKLNDGDGLPQYYGMYYSWYAATAGSGTWAMGNGEIAENSVCPTNWQLPDFSIDKSFYDLFVTNYDLSSGQNSGTDSKPGRSSNTIKKAPFSIIASGFYAAFTGILSSRNDRGTYWVYRKQSSNTVRYLNFGPNQLLSPGNGDSHNGFTVRCVAR